MTEARNMPPDKLPREESYCAKFPQQVCGNPGGSGVLKGPQLLCGLSFCPNPSDLLQSPCIPCLRSGAFWRETGQGLEAVEDRDDVVFSMTVVSLAPSVGRGGLVQWPQ